jgi:peptidoglycan/xylan/chitin deacetylase (PgdA/CDA1 family)
MLISTMYHHINSDKYSNNLDIFINHLKYIKSNYNIVLPNDNISSNSICLTFDDAFFDFYYYIFPLLKKFNMKVILAVPVKYILEDTLVSSNDRLSISHDDSYSNKESFCTYKELKKMVDSKLVYIASHSYSHTNLTMSNNLSLEIIESKSILEKKLNIKVDTFIFPFGKYDKRVLDMCKRYYKYLFRIGNGMNKDFNGVKGLIYRINADNLKDEKNIFSKKNIFKYKLKSLIKSF